MYMSTTNLLDIQLFPICNAEFDITNFLNENNNEIRLIVFKWCAMSYLKDQDKLRMSGLGSNSCGPELKKEYQLSEEEFSYKFILNINNIWFYLAIFHNINLFKQNIYMI